MRFRDLIALSYSALRQQKTRTALTTLGVLLGSCMLAISLSIGVGVKNAVRHMMRKNNELRSIHIYAAYKEPTDDEAGVPPEALEVKGDMSEEKRKRIRKMLAKRWRETHSRNTPVPLTRPLIEQLARIPHVESFEVSFWENGRVMVQGQTALANIQAARPDNKALPHRTVAGGMFTSDDSRGILIHEFLLYELGIRSDADAQAIIGKPIRLELTNAGHSPMQLLLLLQAKAETLSQEELQTLEKVARQLPAAIDRLDLTDVERQTLHKLLKNNAPTIAKEENITVVEEFTVAGVFRHMDRKEAEDERILDYFYPYGEVIVPMHSAQEFVDRLPRRQEHGYDNITLMVDKEENVEYVTDQIEPLGVQFHSPLSFLKHVLREVKLIQYFTVLLSAVALLVAGLGITNTMVTSVLERTPEIGIMKAVGARDRHIMFLFLVEAAWIGLLGGLLGLLAAWLISIPGDGIARRLMEQQAQAKVEVPMFLFPYWLVTLVPLFAMLITVVAAAYPARRAARVDPIQALRHE
ncbi:MAG TPA: ABC transporter permease [Gemmataceae bacterium]|nr:ABC transporter permease [Gemmataceae bacterium]